MRKKALRLLQQNGVFATAVLVALVASRAVFAQAQGSRDGDTETPIKHVIIMIGENRTFDHVFATYKPAKRGRDGLQPSLPGHRQRRRDARPELRQGQTVLGVGLPTPTSWRRPKTPYATLPPAMVGGRARRTDAS